MLTTLVSSAYVQLTYRTRGSNLKLIAKITIGLLIILVGTLIWQGTELYRFANLPAGVGQAPELTPVLPGENFASLSNKLAQQGIISNIRYFKLLAMFRGDDKNLKAGEYPLSAAMTPNQVLDVLVDGKTYLHRITIPEGFTLKQIAEELRKSQLGHADEFLTLAKDPQYVSSFEISASSLEGYLFPDTYYFPKSATTKMIISKMIERFDEQFQAQWYDRAKAMGLTVHEIVTLASIIEKETGAAFERPIISSVFHNRLKKKMRLESDPTVIYDIPNFDGNIKRKHLRALTPYNTYRIKGLPPGPIANPGQESIKAALYPHKTDYLFFVSKKDTTHHFSKTIQEHQRAVRKYQLRRPKKPKT